MKPRQDWLKNQRTALWHLRHGGVRGYREWRARKNVSSPVKTYGVKPPGTTISDLEVPVVAGLATMPSRIDVLRESFNSIYWQVDEVHVYLNKFKNVPRFLRRPRVTIYRSHDYEDYKDVGKFFALNHLTEGILFTVDDDILYPPDYISRMLSYLAATNFEAVIGVHGFQLPRFPKSFFDRRLFHFRRGFEDVAFASVLGTGTTAFNINKLGLSFEDFPTYGMADIHFAKFLKEKNVPALIIPRSAEWLKPLAPSGDEEEPESLFDQTAENAAPHNTILRSVAPWGEEDTLLRWKSLSDDRILSKTLVEALQCIRNSNNSLQESSPETEVGESTALLDILSWLELYADLPTHQHILTRTFDVNLPSVIRRSIIQDLWKIDATKALQLSREVIRRKPSDTAALAQHAKLCAGYFLNDEAQEYYLRALQLAGTKNLKTTRSILFEYYKFLVRCRDFENAAIVASSLRPTHSKSPLFMASMVHVQLHNDQIDDAQDWLVALFNSQQRSTREKAIRTLVNAIAEVPPVLSRPIDTIEVQTFLTTETSFEDLVALLKIATVVDDREGAQKVWQVIAGEYSDQLKTRPDLHLYYTTNWEADENSRGVPFVGHKKVLNMRGVREVVEEGPLVSVLLTAYNSEATIGYAIESVLIQSYRNIELIVVDDHSQDSTVDIAESWARRDSRVLVLRNHENLGPYMSRNIALNHAQGEFIAIQDADDVSVIDRIQVQVGEFGPGIKAVLGQHMRMDTQGRIHLENDGSISGHGPVTLMVRRQVFDEIGDFAKVRTRGGKEFESRIENFYGSDALKRTSHQMVYVLHDVSTNSWRETATDDKRRDLMLFEERYSREHSLHQF
jgi:hypothetical protein